MENLNTSHIRSTSLPSRLNPSNFSQIKINLNKLKTLAPFDSSARIHNGLVCLIELYVSVDHELIGSSHETQRFSLPCRNKALLDDTLAVSTSLLDSYSNLVELLAQMKQNVRVLQFALRRKHVGTYASSECHLNDYFSSRKIAKKNIFGCLGSLQQLERKIESYINVAGEDHHLSTAIGVLCEIFIATISMFRYVLLILLGKQKLDKGFSFITKLIPMSKPSCHKSHEIVSDVDIVDVTLDTLWKDVKTNEWKTVDVEMAIERLQRLDRQIEGYEVGLDTLFRKLIQSRVSLLNILAN
ncbi:hypothetical protein QVD17_18829 [Tagetes erecta]|uniref:Uncharacterized protein n=1 Tax=Tagetes erecta TaxID=13708 RepID=A0AAD8NPF0_TARER|nr:hypothetical protein QVD17_18829 [Tagetes erecta]